MIVGRSMIDNHSPQYKLFRALAENSIPKVLFTILGPFCLEKTPLPNLVQLIRTQAILLIDLLSLGKDLLGGDAGCLGI